MAENVNGKTWLLVIVAAFSIIGVIVIGALWSGVKIPSFHSELDRPIGELDPNPQPNLPPWALGGSQNRPPKGNPQELGASIKEAKKNLPQFVAAIKSPTSTQSRFCICGRQYFNNEPILVWFDAVRTSSGRYTGTTISKYDGEISGAQNFTWDLSEDEILDWLYFDDGKMVGGYSAGYFHRNR